MTLLTKHQQKAGDDPTFWPARKLEHKFGARGPSHHSMNWGSCQTTISWQKSVQNRCSLSTGAPFFLHNLSLWPRNFIIEAVHLGVNAGGAAYAWPEKLALLAFTLSNIRGHKTIFPLTLPGKPLFLSRVDPNDGHGSAQSNICDHKCWRAKIRAEMAQFTYKQHAPPEHWPYLMLFVGEGGGAAPFCNCRFTRQDPTAYPSSEVRCLRDKCIKLASRSCLGKRTVSRNHVILARNFKGTNM